MGQTPKDLWYLRPSGALGALGVWLYKWGLAIPFIKDVMLLLRMITWRMVQLVCWFEGSRVICRWGGTMGGSVKLFNALTLMVKLCRCEIFHIFLQFVVRRNYFIWFIAQIASSRIYSWMLTLSSTLLRTCQEKLTIFYLVTHIIVNNV